MFCHSAETNLLASCKRKKYTPITGWYGPILGLALLGKWSHRPELAFSPWSVSRVCCALSARAYDGSANRDSRLRWKIKGSKWRPKLQASMEYKGKTLLWYEMKGEWKKVTECLPRRRICAPIENCCNFSASRRASARRDSPSKGRQSGFAGLRSKTTIGGQFLFQHSNEKIRQRMFLQPRIDWDVRADGA